MISSHSQVFAALLWLTTSALQVVIGVLIGARIAAHIRRETRRAIIAYAEHLIAREHRAASLRPYGEFKRAVIRQRITER